MTKENEILRDKVLKGTQRAIDKLIIEAKRDGRDLIVSKKEEPVKIAE
ncbi:MAG: hypothetical protein NT007_08985 [Candidatus Kapabacteria bacterium]|nr:hypothetical protein [Candidatus Kapabacteria bacterium]